MKSILRIFVSCLALAGTLLAQTPVVPAAAWLPKGRVVWSMDFGEDQSPVLISGTHAYVHLPLDGGRLEKLDLGTGKQAWAVESSRKALAKISGLGPRLFLVTGDFELVCLDDVSGQTLWTTPLESVSSGGAGFGSVIVLRSAIRAIQRVGDTVLVATYGTKLFKGRTGKVYALDAESGKLRWSFEAEDGVEQNLIEHEGRVYFGGVAAAYAVDLKTGAQIWKASLRNDNQWSFLLRDGLVLVSSGHYVSQGSMSGGTLYALDAQTGLVRWKFDISGPSRVWVDQGIVVGLEWSSFGGSRLTALKLETGAKLWEYKEKSAAAPVVKDGRVIYVSKDNRIHLLDLQTGKMIKAFAAAGDFEMGALSPWSHYFGPLLLDGEAVQLSWAKKTDETVFERLDVAGGMVAEVFRQKGRVRSVLRLPGRLALYCQVGDHHFRAVVLE